MEISRIWRTRGQRLRLEGYKTIHRDGAIEYEFPPKANYKTLYDSSLLLPPDNKVIHCEVVGENQEQDHKGQN